MWELIRRNRLRSAILFTGLGACLIVLGYLIGAAVAPPDGGFFGIAGAAAVWILWSLIAYFAGDSILLHLSGAREVNHDVHPRLFNVVEEMKIAASLPAMPKVYIMDEAAPNAFAVGRKPEKSAIAVTAGLLSQVNRDELQGVVAHETAHILNRDVLLMTFAGILLGSIVMISEIFLRGIWYSGGSSRRFRSGRSKGGGQAQAVFLIAALVFAILAPILAQLLYLAISRRREYLADATAARLTRYPEGLASALEKISNSTIELPRANRATAPMYIMNPLKKKGRSLSSLTSTHPPIEERIQILRTMAGGAGYPEYEKAFARVSGKKSIIPGSGLEKKEAVPIRAASPLEAGSLEAGAAAGAKGGPGSQKRDLNDLMRAMNNFAFLACGGCGLKIKTPPDLEEKAFPCPRCGHEVRLPAALPAAAAVLVEAAEASKGQQAEEERQVYQRRSEGWETFACRCGGKVNLSPVFAGDRVNCSRCGRTIAVEKEKTIEG